MILKDKVIILTGGARIGKAVAKELSLRGAHIAFSYLHSQPELAGSGDAAFRADLSKAEDVARFVEEVKKEFGRIDALVHMASTYPRTPWETLTEAGWDQSMNAIAKSAFLLGKTVAGEMLKNESEPVKGKIILFADWSVLERPYKDFLPYNVAKAAVIGLTKSLAKELAPHILVNCIAPGPILKPPDLSEEENAEVLKNTPLGRWGGAEEIAKAVLYLMEADFVTGQVLTVDGGRTIG